MPPLFVDAAAAATAAAAAAAAAPPTLADLLGGPENSTEGVEGGAGAEVDRGGEGMCTARLITSPGLHTRRGDAAWQGGEGGGEGVVVMNQHAEFPSSKLGRQSRQAQAGHASRHAAPPPPPHTHNQGS